MEHNAVITPKMVMHARIYRAHPKPEGMTEEEYKKLLATHHESVGHWENLGQIASSEDGTLTAKAV